MTLILNTDGLEVHSNPINTAWPVFAVIPELPPNKRFLSDKIINVALWASQGKPPMKCIFRYFQQQIDNLNDGEKILRDSAANVS